MEETKVASPPRLSRLAKTEVDAETGQIFDTYQKERGNVPNMFRTVAHRPEILRSMIAHLRAVMNTGTVPVKLKELVIVRTSQLNRCEY
jgi:alkylhydroperoxidase family enzyme